MPLTILTFEIFPTKSEPAEVPPIRIAPAVKLAVFAALYPCTPLTNILRVPDARDTAM